MQCDRFQHHIDELLDHRQEIRSDAELTAHAAACPACRRLWDGYESMLLGLDLLGTEEPVERFVERTVETSIRRRRLRTFRRAVAAVAIAAGLLIVIGPAWFAPRHAPHEGGRNGLDSLFAANEPPSPTSGREQADQSLARVWHATGRNLAELPWTVRRVAAHPETDRIVGHIRPLTAPVGTAWEVLLRTWPGVHTSSAAVPQADTGYVQWHVSWLA